MPEIILVAQEHGAGEAIGGILSVMLIFWIFAIAATIFWIWALVDALTHERNTNDKILWFLVIFFLHFIGAVIYFAARALGPEPGAYLGKDWWEPTWKH